jgi:hypothetical protein
MDLTRDEYEPVILLNDGRTFSGLGGCQLIVLTQEEAECVADDNCLSWMKAVACPNRTFDLEKMCAGHSPTAFGPADEGVNS